MERRDILKLAATLTGSAICAPISVALLSGITSSKANAMSMTAAGKTPAFFKADTFQLMSQIMDVILPKTNTPSATEVSVNWIMDNMFAKVFKDGYRKDFLRKFSELEKHLSKLDFASASATNQLAIIKQIEATPENKRSAFYRAYTDLKQQTISYYLATEQVAERHLNYLPIPGGYTPCISVKDVGGKAWAE